MLLHWGSFIGPYPLVTIGNVSVEWVCHARLLIYKFKCDLCDAGYVGFTSGYVGFSRKKKGDLIDWQAFWRQAFFGPKGSYKEFSFIREVYEKIGLPAL